MKKDDSILILMRHGESIWNQRNLFTGWVDVPLSQKGIEEALKGGEEIKDISIDVAFTSTLVRAQTTLFLALLNHSSKKTPVMQNVLQKEQSGWDKIFSEEMKKEIIPVYYSWHLNERMYGELQGRNKDETRKIFGKEQVEIWRRSFEVAPPHGESLKMTAERTLPFFREKILPLLRDKKNVFISAHGNSLRSIVMELDNLSKEEVVKLEIPTGKPLLYQYKNSKWSRLNV